MRIYTDKPVECFIHNRVPQKQFDFHRIYSSEGIFEVNQHVKQLMIASEPLERFQDMTIDPNIIDRQEVYTIPYPHVSELVHTDYYSIYGTTLVVEYNDANISDYYFIGNKSKIIEFLTAFT